MKRILILILIVGSSLGLEGLAADRDILDQSLEAQDNGFVRIQVTRGDVSVRGWDKPLIRVTGQLDSQTDSFVFKVDGDQADIRVRLPHRTGWFGGDASDLKVALPRGSSVEFDGVSTDLDVSGIDRGLTVRNVSGDITIRSISKGVDIKTVSGEVRSTNTSGNIRIRTISGDIRGNKAHGPGSYHSVSGNIEIMSDGGRLNLDSVSGDLDVKADALRELSASSVSGNIDVSARLNTDGSIDVSTVSGDIDLDVPEDTDAVLEIKAGSGGRIRNRLTEDKPLSGKYSRNRTLRFTLGDGSGEIVLHTASGRIVLGD